MKTNDIQQTNWNLIRTYFITQTGSARGEAESINAVAKRFNVSAAALSKMANSPNKLNKTWHDLRTEFLEKNAINNNSEKLSALVSKFEKTRDIFSLVNSTIFKELLNTLKDDESRKRFIKSLKPKDILEFSKYENELNSKIIEYTKQGLTKKGTSIVLNIDKPYEEMSIEEIDQLISKTENFSFENTEYTVIEEE